MEMKRVTSFAAAAASALPHFLTGSGTFSIKTNKSASLMSERAAGMRETNESSSHSRLVVSIKANFVASQSNHATR